MFTFTPTCCLLHIDFKIILLNINTSLNTGKLSSIFCVIFFIVTSLIAIGSLEWKKGWVLNWDNAGYHSYNPAFVIYHDWHQFLYYERIDAKYKPSGETLKHGLLHNEYNSNYVIKYPCGVALIQLPFFLISDAYCRVTNSYPRDGYSAPYQLSVVLSTIVFCFIGILFLRRFLLNYISDVATMLCLAIILLGTNLFYYVNFDQGMSHVYLFSIYCLLLFYTDRWHRTYHPFDLYKISFLLGFSVLIRPTDFLFILIPIFWNIDSKEKWLHLFSNFKTLTGSLLFYFLPLSLQLFYWKEVTGHWIYYSYIGEGFHFLHWEIIPAMLNLKHGWLTTNPLVILGFIGFAFMLRRQQWKFYTHSFLLYFLSSLYLLFCWWQWYYGGSYGCRVMIQSLALLALPIGILMDVIRTSRFLWMRNAFFCILLLGIVLNIYHSIQYNNGMCAWSKSMLGN